MQRCLLILVNPASGSKQSRTEADSYIIPLLKGSHLDISLQVEDTAAPQHAGELAKEFILSGAGRDIVIAGGDGTIHEVINAVETLGDAAKNDVNLVLWPSGTANALYHSTFVSTLLPPELRNAIPSDIDEALIWKFTSILLYIGSQKNLPGLVPKPLSVAHTQIFDNDGQVTAQALSTVVTSTALHAAILHTAEDLRASMPSLERFQEAARRNITTWSNASVKIFDSTGSSSQGVEIYHPATKSFVPLPPAYRTSSLLEMSGPFSYFLSTVNVDRLEEKFEITSLYTSHPPPIGANTMEIVVLRPERDPAVKPPDGDKAPSPIYPEETRQAFAIRTVSQALRKAYDKGSHVDVAYPNGQPVVEYFRAGGWEWVPDPGSEASLLVCADGTILHIPLGGRARCQLIPTTRYPRFHVWVLPASTFPDLKIKD